MAKQHRLRVIIVHDPNGQPIIKQIAANSETALADMVVRAIIKSGRIAEFIPRFTEKSSAAAIVASSIPKTLLADYVQRWRKTYKQGLSPTTEVFYDAKQSVILKSFGSMYIEDIRPDDIQRFLNERAKQYKKKTVKDDLAFLRMVLDSAMNDEIIPKNPAKDRRIFNPAEEGSGTSSLTREQIISIQKSIPHLEDKRRDACWGCLPTPVCGVKNC